MNKETNEEVIQDMKELSKMFSNDVRAIPEVLDIYVNQYPILKDDVSKAVNNDLTAIMNISNFVDRNVVPQGINAREYYQLKSWYLRRCIAQSQGYPSIDCKDVYSKAIHIDTRGRKRSSELINNILFEEPQYARQDSNAIERPEQDPPTGQVSQR